MSRDNKASGCEDIIEMFRGVDTSEFPPFDSYNKPLEIGLWVLWVVKDVLQIESMTAEQISSISRDVMEVKLTTESITRAFARAGDRIDTYRSGGELYFRIMKSGREHLLSLANEGGVGVCYFTAGKRYTSKKLLTESILHDLKGELRIVDPYCGERTLDVLSSIKDRPVKFLTRTEKLRQAERTRFLRELKDFQSENPNIEFRDYLHEDIHDRYILSSTSLVILGHSIKDLGSKESFAVVLNETISSDVVRALRENFDRRWDQSYPI
ncbi:MAG: hypothetical protein FJ006_05320 [Chloroflexi bacterium]|nr:hypothetical protein [Chloroflexota bacterium]